MAGFKSYTQTAEVRNGEKTRIDATMTIGTVGQSVTVESTQMPTLDVSTAQLSDSLSSEEVQSLPNLSRDPVAFATLDPGTVPVTKDNPFLGVGSFNSNGSRGRADNITLDGVTAADVSTTGESGSAFTDQDVLEFKVITNNFDAEFGRNSGAQVQIITKSGTNQYHGEAYYFAQNTFFGNAVDYFTPATAPGIPGEPTPIIQNQGGANHQGPYIYLRVLGDGSDAWSGRNGHRECVDARPGCGHHRSHSRGDIRVRWLAHFCQRHAPRFVGQLAKRAHLDDSSGSTAARWKRLSVRKVRPESLRRDQSGPHLHQQQPGGIWGVQHCFTQGSDR